MTTALVMLRIEVDGHFRGMRSRAAIPRPWVAEIVGTCERNGLRRGDFVERMTDWSQAHVAHSGNLYGRVDTYALREGRMYEVSRCEGSPSRRHVKRRLYVAREGQLVEIQRHEAISMMAALEADNEEASCPEE